MLILTGQSDVFMQIKCLCAILLNLTSRNKTKQNKNCLERNEGNSKKLVRSNFRREKGKESLHYFAVIKHVKEESL